MPQSAIPWKNTLLTKETEDAHQNPLVYFDRLLTDSDTFIVLYDELLEKRSKGTRLGFVDDNDNKPKQLDSFLIVQDERGVHWICPVIRDGNRINHTISVLNLSNTDTKEPYRSKEPIGFISMSVQEYSDACSRGFENASMIFLGQQRVSLDNKYRLIASFHMTAPFAPPMRKKTGGATAVA